MLKRKCLICKKSLLVKKSHAKRGWGKYCSKKCQFKGQYSGKWLQCDYCGNNIYRRIADIRKSKSKKFFCSRNCHCSWENENVRCGENAPNWVAGHYVYRKIMKRLKIKEKCARCGTTDKRVLVVHHKDKNRRNNKALNLIWLCRNCHCIVHTI